MKRGGLLRGVASRAVSSRTQCRDLLSPRSGRGRRNEGRSRHCVRDDTTRDPPRPPRPPRFNYQRIPIEMPDPATTMLRLAGRLSRFLCALALFAAPRVARAQEPLAWRDSLVFHTFSIAAVDPRTGEVGVAVTTRVPCVGNGVPWVRAGVGAVATQANTRTEYGTELLDALARGEAPADALKRLIAADSGAASRQVGVIDIKGRTAQHTGTGPQQWAGHRAGANYVTQGNILVGPQVIEAVAKTFEAS